MPLVLSFLLRILLLAAGLVFAASLLLVVGLLAAFWCVRAVWARLLGRPVAPFVVRFGARQAFDGVMRRAPPQSRTPRADAATGPRTRTRLPDVTDVQPRDPAGT